MLVVVVAVVVVLAGLYVLTTTMTVRSSGTGTIVLVPVPSDPLVLATGWQPFNTSLAGSVAVTWTIVPAGALGGMVIVSGNCHTAAGCEPLLQDEVVCQGPSETSGAGSSTCTFSGPAGTYTLVPAIVSGYVQGTTGETFSYTVSTPMLSL